MAKGYGNNVRAFFLNIRNPYDFGDGFLSPEDAEAETNKIKNNGHDGVIKARAIKSRNEYVAFEPTQIKSATDNSGDFLIDDPNIYHQFAGENAETADKMKLAEAERMEAEGKAAQEIFAATGWLKGQDGKWRFEIPDNLDKIDLSEVEALPHEKMAVFLGSVYDNPALYEAYPWLKEILVLKKILPQGTRGQVESNAGEPVIVLNATLLSSDMAKQTPLLKMALVHEIQHVIQKREGFAGGGNPETVRANILREIDRIVMLTDWKDEDLKKIASLQRRVEETGDMENGDTDQFFSAMQELAAFEKSLPKDKQTQIRGSFFRIHALQKAVDTKSDFDLYERLGGEQEAREAADRAESGAYETMPHPHRYDTLIVFGGKEMPYSENRDERLAGNRAVGKNINDIKGFRGLFDKTTLRLWGNVGVGFMEQEKVFEDTVNEIKAVSDRLSEAQTQDDIDSIREHLDEVLENVVNFNKGGIRKDEYAVKVRIAREVFEHHEEVIKARTRVGQKIRQLDESTRDNGIGSKIGDGSIYVAGSDGSSQQARTNYSEAFSVSAERDDANNHYNALYEQQLESDKKLHPQEFAQAQSRSEHQGGFSDGQILDQNGGKVTRGRIWRDRRQGKKIIQLLSTADRSTFLHEMGHLFLMDLEDLAAMGDEESQRMLDEVDDWAKWQGKGDAKKYAGTAWAKEFADREAAILEADRAGDLLGRDALMAQWRQERFARAWEIYLKEGKAPTKGIAYIMASPAGCQALFSWLSFGFTGLIYIS